ncbi:MAG: hypothetical protein AABX10_03680 [Nanoarchaeota archaeon]
MNKKKQSKIFYFAFLVSFLFLFAVTIFYFDSKDKLLLSPRSKLILPSSNSTPPTTASPYCTIPLAVGNLTNGGVSPDIFGRTIVSISPSFNGITFYDGGVDLKFGNADDLGVIQPSSLQFLNGLDYPKIKGSNVIFTTSNFSATGAQMWNLMIYSLGIDNIAGTSDDFGPATIFSSTNPESIAAFHIDQDLVTFVTENSNSFIITPYYCTSNFPLGSCWTSSPQLFEQNLVPADQFGYYMGSMFGNILHYFESNGLIYYNFTYQTGIYSPSSTSFETLEDISSPFVLKSISNGSSLSNRLALGYTFSNQFSFPISPSSIGTPFYDWGGSLAKNPPRSGNYLLLAWVRSIPNVRNYYVVSNFPSSQGEVIIPNINPATSPRLDGNNVVFVNRSSRVHVSECYF